MGDAGVVGTSDVSSSVGTNEPGEGASTRSISVSRGCSDGVQVATCPSMTTLLLLQIRERPR